MKSLFLFTLFSVSAMFGSAESTMQHNQGLLMQLDSEEIFQQMVRIYAYDGELLKEFTLTDVVNNNLSNADHMTLQESDFAFHQAGDYYYFGDDVANGMIN